MIHKKHETVRIVMSDDHIKAWGPGTDVVTLTRTQVEKLLEILNTRRDRENQPKPLPACCTKVRRIRNHDCTGVVITGVVQRSYVNSPNYAGLLGPTFTLTVVDPSGYGSSYLTVEEMLQSWEIVDYSIHVAGGKTDEPEDDIVDSE